MDQSGYKDEPVVIRKPEIDLDAIRSGDDAAFMRALLGLAWDWFHAGGSSLAFPMPASRLAMKEDRTRTGLLAAAVEIRKLLRTAPKGREVLRDLGLERLFQDFDCE